VKTLPDDPSLDHLRRQAKDLLAGLRAADPAAGLADAQAALARRYGFRDWPQLKAEVDRRAGTADVADGDLAREVAAAFGLGVVTGPMRSLARADDAGRPWMLTTDRGRWTVRTVDGIYPPTDGEDAFALQEAAATAGVVLPRPVRSLAGTVDAQVGGHRWRAHEWWGSAPPLTAPVGADTARAAGDALARVHGLRVRADEVHGWFRPLRSKREWTGLVDRTRTGGHPWAEQLAVAACGLAALHRTEDGPAEPPLLAHNNLTPGSCRLAGAGRVLVTGWEHAGGQPPSWELGFVLLQWTVDPGGRVNAAGVRALLDGYGAVAGTVPDPSFRGATAGLLNYLFGQAEAALAPDAHARRSVCHLLRHLPIAATLDELRQAEAR